MALNFPNCTVKIVPIESINEGERFRKDYGDLTDLCHSIKTNGLINPVAVTWDQNDEGHFLLVAGGRRLAAMKLLKSPTIEVRIFPKMDEMQLRILELAENMQRKDMSWMESNSLQREIHRLQQTVHGKSAPGPKSEKKGWKVEDTAKMLGVSPSTVSNSIVLADKVEKYSAIADFSKCKTENEAKKQIKNLEEAALRVELLKRASDRQGSAFSKTIIDSYMIGDFLEYGPKLEENYFDFAEVDPPYGMDLPESKHCNDCLDYVEVPKDQYLIFTEQVMQNVYRSLKENTFAVYWFNAEPWMEHIYRIALKAGFDTTRNVLIWPKPSGQAKNPSTHLARAYEMAFLLRKGFPYLAKKGHSDIFNFEPTPHQNKFHPTQKPLDLYKEIYQTFSFENARCLVPFAGSGVSLLAAYLTKRSAIGYDLSEQYKGGFISMVNEHCLLA